VGVVAGNTKMLEGFERMGLECVTLEQAWKLHLEWRLPADALIRPYPLRPG